MPTGTQSIVTREVDGCIVNSFLATKGELDLIIKLEIPAGHSTEIVSIIKTSPDYMDSSEFYIPVTADDIATFKPHNAKAPEYDEVYEMVGANPVKIGAHHLGPGALVCVQYEIITWRVQGSRRGATLAILGILRLAHADVDLSSPKKTNVFAK
jgi:hypothetical protein